MRIPVLRRQLALQAQQRVPRCPLACLNQSIQAGRLCLVNILVEIGCIGTPICEFCKYLKLVKLPEKVHFCHAGIRKIPNSYYCASQK